MKSHKMFLVVALLIVACALDMNASARQESERDRSRDAWQRPAEVFDALGLNRGHRMADIGCGFGYFTFRLAARVGAEGKVFAVDVDQKAIDKVRQRREREKLEQVEPISERALTHAYQTISIRC